MTSKEEKTGDAWQSLQRYIERRQANEVQKANKSKV